MSIFDQPPGDQPFGNQPAGDQPPSTQAQGNQAQDNQAQRNQAQSSQGSPSAYDPKRRPRRIPLAKRPVRRDPYAQRHMVTMDKACSWLTTKGNWGTRVRETEVVLRWEEIVGVIIAREVRPRWIHNQVLHVTTSTAHWSAMVRMNEHVILEGITRAFGREMVTAIVIDSVHPDDKKVT